MRQRLLAQQLGLSSPQPNLRKESENKPSTPTKDQKLPQIQPWRSEPRVKVMPFSSTPATPDRTQRPWGAQAGTPTSAALSRRGFPMSPEVPRTPTNSNTYYTGAAGSSTPLESSHVSAAERDRQIQTMLSSMVTVMKEVDLSKTRVPGMECTLLPHQVQGVDWMRRREHGISKGGILADDMGLGKTVQMIALMLYHCHLDDLRGESDDVREENVTSIPNDDLMQKCRKEVFTSGTSTTLIIAPLAVIEQWKQECVDKTGRRLKVLVHHGPQRAKCVEDLKKVDVVITTYATAAMEHNSFLEATGALPPKPTARKKKGAGTSMARDSDLGSSDSDDPEPLVANAKSSKTSSKKSRSFPLYEMKWLRVVLDEAQTIKNYRTKSSLACFQLSLQAASRWCISGTPLQNNALEIFSLIHFLRISPFDDLKHFQEKINEPLNSPRQSRIDLGLRRLSVVLQSIMLRRTKDAEYQGKKLLNLPPRSVEILTRDFESSQERDFYRELEERVQMHFKDNKHSQISYMGVLLMLLRLRQACNHPVLVTGRNIVSSQNEPTSSSSNTQDDDEELAALLSGLSVKARHCERCQVPLSLSKNGEEASTLCTGCTAQRDLEVRSGTNWNAPGTMSTKLRMIVDLLHAFEKESRGDKTIIFSQFTSFLDLIEPVLHSHGYNYVRYDGSMRPNARQEALNRIRSDEGANVILISFKAGSTGLNLTCCNRVILCDLWWNPQIEEQAFDRAHRCVYGAHTRLGQSKHVYIYKLSIEGTVEQRILVLQVCLDPEPFTSGKKARVGPSGPRWQTVCQNATNHRNSKSMHSYLTQTQIHSISRICASCSKAMYNSSSLSHWALRAGTCTAQKFPTGQ